MEMLGNRSKRVLEKVGNEWEKAFENEVICLDGCFFIRNENAKSAK